MIAISGELQNKLNSLPKTPGCYLFKNEKEEIIYVGKAISLRSRVRSYFQNSSKHSSRIARMVQRIRDLEWMLVDNELEALVLECNLIKKHRPYFNVRLRDDKNYPYITITNETYPRVMFTRQLTRNGAKYFGPYPSAYDVRNTLQLLHKIFPLIPCGKSWSGQPLQRPCLYYHIGQCLGPCAGLSDRKVYQSILDQVKNFLSGKEEGLLHDLKVNMQQAADQLEFEKAAKLRDQVHAIENILQRQNVLSTDKVDRDVIAVVKDDGRSAIQMLYIRSGKLIGQKHFFLEGASESAPSESIQEFVKQYYSDAPDVPQEVLLPVEIDERLIVQQWLKSRRGSAVKVSVPHRGEKLDLLDLAAKNAEQALSVFKLEMEQKELWAEQAMMQLQESLNLPTPPARIECFDISNIQGTSAVGSMVVTENGHPSKGEYRRFKIKENPETPNDFAMMHEVLSRRLSAYVEGNQKFSKQPDLILIDGGKGQLMAALKARDELNLTIPMAGLAKKHEILFLPVDIFSELVTKNEIEPGLKTYQYQSVELPLNSPGLLLLRKLRDEAHRFAITYHRKIRQQRSSHSVLDEVPGIGTRRRTMLLRTFGSIEAIAQASVEELASVPTMTKPIAQKINEYLTKQANKE